MKGAAAATANEKVFEWLMDPLVPVTVTVLVPTVADDEAANWNDAPVPDPVMTRAGRLPGVIITPAGRPETVRLIVPVNPFAGVALITWPWLTPCGWRLTLASSNASEKSGGGGGGGGGGGEEDDPPPPQAESNRIAASVPVARGMYKTRRDGRSVLRNHKTILMAMSPMHQGSIREDDTPS